MKKTNKKFLFLLPLIFISLIIGSFALLGSPSSSTTSKEMYDITGNVCVSVNEWDEETQSYTGSKIVQCDHNVAYSTGLNSLRNIIGNGASEDPFQIIALCNATAGCGTPVAAQTEAFTEYINCGLNNATGTYGALGGVGNWSIHKTFTSTCDNVITNSTKLRNTAYTNLSGNTFALVTLQTNDQLTINWTLTFT